MRERSAIVVSGLVLLLVLLPLGFLIHVSPRFPGSLPGSLIGILGALLMLVPLAYLTIKRVPRLHDKVTKRVGMRTLLSIHIYAGIFGPILGVVHAAHKFESPLGVSLTGLMIVVVLSGYTGRYLMGEVSRAIRGRKSELAALSGQLNSLPPEAVKEAVSLAASVSDVEFAVRAEEVVNSLFEKWLRLHIVIAIALYGLLALHIWAGLYYGLRWL